MDWSITTPTWITAIATAVLAILGGLTAWAAIKTLRQARADSLARTRPYIFAHLVPGVMLAGAWDLLVKNAGQSTASDLRISIDPLPAAGDEITDALSQMTETTLSLPPGMSHRMLWSMRPPEGQTWADGTSEPIGLGNTATITATYKLERSYVGRRAEVTFKDEYEVRTSGIGLTPLPTSGSEPDGEYTLKHIHKQLGLIAQNIRMNNYS